MARRCTTGLSEVPSMLLELFGYREDVLANSASITRLVKECHLIDVKNCQRQELLGMRYAVF